MTSTDSQICLCLTSPGILVSHQLCRFKQSLKATINTCTGFVWDKNYLCVVGEVPIMAPMRTHARSRLWSPMWIPRRIADDTSAGPGLARWVETRIENDWWWFTMRYLGWWENMEEGRETTTTTTTTTTTQFTDQQTQVGGTTLHQYSKCSGSELQISRSWRLIFLPFGSHLHCPDLPANDIDFTWWLPNCFYTNHDFVHFHWISLHDDEHLSSLSSSQSSALETPWALAFRFRSLLWFCFSVPLKMSEQMAPPAAQVAQLEKEKLKIVIYTIPMMLHCSGEVGSPASKLRIIKETQQRYQNCWKPGTKTGKTWSTIVVPHFFYLLWGYLTHTWWGNLKPSKICLGSNGFTAQCIHGRLNCWFWMVRMTKKLGGSTHIKAIFEIHQLSHQTAIFWWIQTDSRCFS